MKKIFTLVLVIFSLTLGVFAQASSVDDGEKSTNNVSQIADINKVNGFSVYPNPANEKFTMNFDFSEGAYVEVYNILGNLVVKVNPALGMSTTIDCSKWEKGYYFCRLVNDNKVEKTLKLIITH